MGKDLNVSMLLDFYGELLTEKQADALDLYYNQDLSLSEISEHLSITRQGVRDNIKRGEKQLCDFEECLGLASKFEIIKKKCNNITKEIDEVLEYETSQRTLELFEIIKSDLNNVLTLI